MRLGGRLAPWCKTLHVYLDQLSHSINSCALMVAVNGRAGDRAGRTPFVCGMDTLGGLHVGEERSTKDEVQDKKQQNQRSIKTVCVNSGDWSKANTVDRSARWPS